MTSAVQWRYRFLLGIVLLDVVLASPLVRRNVDESIVQQGNNEQVQLSEDTFGPNLQERGDREKRLFKLKTLGVASLGAKAIKAVGAKAIAAGAAAIKTKVVKAGAAAKAAAVSAIGLKAKAAAASAIGLKAKAIGAKTITAIAVLGIKTFLFNLLFGKINKLIDFKERLLLGLEQSNRVQNEAFNTNFYEIPKMFNPDPKLDKRKRSRNNYYDYQSERDGGGDWAEPYRFGNGDAYADRSSSNDVDKDKSNSRDNVCFDKPDFLPPPKDLIDTSLTTESSIDYVEYSNSSSVSRSSEMYLNNSAVYEILWRRHGFLRSPWRKHYLESQNLTASNETWSTEAVFGDDDEDYDSPEMSNDLSETQNNLSITPNNLHRTPPSTLPKTPNNSPEESNDIRETQQNFPIISKKLYKMLKESMAMENNLSEVDSSKILNDSPNALISSLKLLKNLSDKMDMPNNLSDTMYRSLEMANNLSRTPNTTPKISNNLPETLNTENKKNYNKIPDISSNNIPVRNYKLKRQKSFHNLKQFKKFYGRNPMKDKCIETQ